MANKKLQDFLPDPGSTSNHCQEFYPVTGCGSEFFPEGRSTNGSPFYREPGSTDRYLYFDHCDGSSQWIIGEALGSCEGLTWLGSDSSATGPPLGDSWSCNLIAEELAVANIHAFLTESRESTLEICTKPALETHMEIMFFSNRVYKPKGSRARKMFSCL